MVAEEAIPNNEQALGCIIFMITFIGTVANSIVAYFTRTLPTMNNPFGRLTASQACGDAILCAVFAFWFAPMMIFDITFLKNNSAQAGWINLICYDICIWSHLFISINRLSAICFPFHYDRIFSVRNTLAVIGISWIIPIITGTILYKFYICDFYYSTIYWAFVFTQSEVCGFISWNIDFYKDISIVIVIACVDVVTIFHVHKTKEIGSLTTSNSTQAARRRREINFLKQAVLQGLIFVVELLTYFIFAWKFENRYVVWCLTTLAWILVHTSDGIIIIAFNGEFRRLVATPFKDMLYFMDDFLLTPMEAVNGGHPPHPQQAQQRPVLSEAAQWEIQAMKDRFDTKGEPEMHDSQNILVTFRLKSQNDPPPIPPVQSQLSALPSISMRD